MPLMHQIKTVHNMLVSSTKCGERGGDTFSSRRFSLHADDLSLNPSPIGNMRVYFWTSNCCRLGNGNKFACWVKLVTRANAFASYMTSLQLPCINYTTVRGHRFNRIFKRICLASWETKESESAKAVVSFSAVQYNFIPRRHILIISRKLSPM